MARNRLNTTLQCHVLLQIVIKKWIPWPLEWLHKFDSSGFFFYFFTKKFIFDYSFILKLPFPPLKWGPFRPVEISGFVWPPNTFILIFLTKISRKFEFFCVSLLYVLCSCEVFPAVWWPPAAARWERKQEVQRSPPEVALEGDGTAD